MKPVCLLLIFLLWQQAIAPAALAQSPSSQLRIVLLNGEGAINTTGQRSGQDPVVRIEDENQKPVAGASVVFSLPTEGPSGEFSNGSKTLIITTDARGEATAAGLRVNNVAGKLQIHINASYRGQTARANLVQFNMNTPGKRSGGSGKWVLALIAIAGGAAAGGVLATRGSGKSSSGSGPTTPSTPPITITPGAGTVGPPR